MAYNTAPEVIWYRDNLSGSYANLSGLERRLGRLAEAAAVSRHRLELWPDNPVELYRTACELALCVPTVGKGKTELTPEEQARGRLYADEALAVLRRAIAKGYRQVDQLKKDSRLDSLRRRADFQQLLRDVESGTRKPAREL
jgi:hypothetical protein